MAGTWKRIITTNDDTDYKNSNVKASDLPVATTSAVGGIQVGSNLSITTAGVLSASSGSNTTNSSMALDTSDGVLTLTDSAGNTVTADLDGRWLDDGITIEGDTNSQTINLGSLNQGNQLDIVGGAGISTTSDTDTITITNDSQNVTTNLAYADHASQGKITSSDGTDAVIPAVSGTKAGLMLPSHASAITANSAKATNVTTNLGVTTSETTVVVTSSDGTDATIPVATTAVGGVMSKAIFDEHTANNAKVSASGLVSCTEANVKSILSALDSADTLHIGDTDNDATIAIRGNLTVSGTTTSVNTETIKLADNVIELNSNYSGSNATENGGIIVNRDSTTGGDASLTWAENADRWMIDYNSQKANIASIDCSSANAPTNDDSMGIGSFWLRTGSNEVYVRTA